MISNLSRDPTKCFESELAIPDSCAGVIHTHPGGTAWPSYRDQAQQIASGVPWGIAPRGDEPFVWGDGVEPPHLIHRPFRWGVTDCWAAVRDGLERLYGESVGTYPREWQFWKAGAVFELHVNAEGFRQVSSDLDDAVEGDVLLMRIRSDVYNHAALVCDAGMAYHHPSSWRPFDDTMPARLDPLDYFARDIAAVSVGVFRRG